MNEMNVVECQKCEVVLVYNGGIKFDYDGCF